ncbi:hypothetical protein RND81_07G123700 [Saponaria officinalis]|uniref:MADS-box domain-containing protein n=1 Tax=Saponaria officinalis TaxID=3572 RepID=A0AAW1JPX0_SAPOF
MAEVLMITSNECDHQKKRTSKGKQPIEIKYIENKNARLVTFTKRRNGLFKKIRDLCTKEPKFDSQAVVITFSQSGKLHSYGYPNRDVVIQRYINSLNNQDLFQTNNNNDNNNNWWDDPIDNLGLDEAERFKAKLEGLRNKVISRIDEISRCENFEFGGNDGNLGAQVSEFECIKMESIDAQEIIRPEFLSQEIIHPSSQEIIRQEFVSQEIIGGSMCNVDENYDFGGNDGNLGAQVSEFEFMEMESIDMQEIIRQESLSQEIIHPSQEIIHPKFVSPDAFLNFSSVKGFV